MGKTNSTRIGQDNAKTIRGYGIAKIELGQIVEKISEPTVAVAERFIRKIPALLIGTIVCILSAYFIVADRERLIETMKKVSPDPIVKRMSLAMYNLK